MRVTRPIHTHIHLRVSMFLRSFSRNAARPSSSSVPARLVCERIMKLLAKEDRRVGIPLDTQPGVNSSNALRSRKSEKFTSKRTSRACSSISQAVDLFHWSGEEIAPRLFGAYSFGRERSVRPALPSPFGSTGSKALRAKFRRARPWGAPCIFFL